MTRGSRQRNETARALRTLAVSLILAAMAALSGCRKKAAPSASDAYRQAYGEEADWNNPDRLIPLNYEQTQGQRVFYTYCVWCHADSTPAGPSNRANLTPTPALMNDGTKLNGLSDAFMRNIITLGGAAMGKSAMMPAYGRTLSQSEIQAVVAFARAIAQPPYQATGRSGPQYSEK